MRGDKRCSSFRKEKPAGLSRALSWLSVSSLSRQSRRIFHSQNELHSAHTRQTRSHPHLYTADGDEEEDQDNWVYQPQHKTGEDEAGKENLHSVYRWWVTDVLHSPCSETRPPTHTTCLSWMHHSVITMHGPQLNGDGHFCSVCQEGSEWLFTCTCKARSGSLSFYGLPHLLGASWLPWRAIWGCVWSLLDDSGVKGRSMHAIGKQCRISPGSGNAMETVMSSGLVPWGSVPVFQCQNKE